MATASIAVIHEVRDGVAGNWQLCFQWGRYDYDDGSPSEYGYRFIWRRGDETLQAARGQARIPDAATMLRLLSRAAEEGWFIHAEAAGGQP